MNAFAMLLRLTSNRTAADVAVGCRPVVIARRRALLLAARSFKIVLLMHGPRRILRRAEWARHA